MVDPTSESKLQLELVSFIPLGPGNEATDASVQYLDLLVLETLLIFGIISVLGGGFLLEGEIFS